VILDCQEQLKNLEKTEATPESVLFKDSLLETIHLKEILISKLNLKLDHTDSLKYQMTFYEGYSFGEKASKNEERRAATCVAIEDCFCGLIDKAQYFKVLKKL